MTKYPASRAGDGKFRDLERTLQKAMSGEPGRNPAGRANGTGTDEHDRAVSVSPEKIRKSCATARSPVYLQTSGATYRVFGSGGFIRRNAMKKPIIAEASTQGNTPR